MAKKQNAGATNARKQQQSPPQPSAAQATGGKWVDTANLAIMMAAKAFDRLCTLGIVVAIATSVYLSIDAMAGKSTDFKSVIQWSAGLGLSEYAAWGMASLFGGGLFYEKRAHTKYRKYAGPKIEEFERMFDPTRGSSGLKSDGSNPPGDIV